MPAGYWMAERVRLLLVLGDQTVPHPSSFSEEIEEISNAFPAVLDCATCGTLQPMKIDLLVGERDGDRKTVAYRCTVCGEVRDREAKHREPRPGDRDGHR